MTTSNWTQKSFLTLATLPVERSGIRMTFNFDDLQPSKVIPRSCGTCRHLKNSIVQQAAGLDNTIICGEQAVHE